MKLYLNSVGALSAALLLFCSLFSNSCSTLSREQLSNIEKLGNGCDSFNRYPSLFFEEIASVRMERGLFYAATLSDAGNRVGELEELYKANEKEVSLASKTDKSLEILRAYSRALGVLVADSRHETRGRELRSLGRALDSLVAEANRLQLFKESLPEGVAKSAGVLVAFGAERMLQNRQHRLARSFIKESDTLVSSLVEGLVEILRLPGVSALIEGEKSGLPADYRSFVATFKGNDGLLAEYDRRYLELYGRVQKLSYLRGSTITAANRLARTHRELVLSLEKGRKGDELYESLLGFEDSLSKLEKEYRSVVSLFD